MPSTTTSSALSQSGALCSGKPSSAVVIDAAWISGPAMSPPPEVEVEW